MDNKSLLIDSSLQNTSQLSTRKINIQIDKPVWISLKKLKKNNETFNDIILELLNKRSKEISNTKIGAVKYSRKVDFGKFGEDIGIQYEFNDIKSLSSFTLDVKIKKIFFGRRTYNPSEFFGVEPKFFYVYDKYLFIYLSTIIRILKKECKVKTSHPLGIEGLGNLVSWRQLYYDYGLSEESFKEDIEEVLRKSEDEELRKRFEKDIQRSPAYKLFK